MENRKTGNKRKLTKTYDPKYEKNRKQKPVSFSLIDPTQARLVDFIGKFEYGVYFKNILAQLNETEQNRIIAGNLNTIPSSLFKQNIVENKSKANEYFTVVDATRVFDHCDLAKHLSDDALLKELANRNLAPIIEKEEIEAPTTYSVHGATHLSAIPNSFPKTNEFGFFEVRNDDGSVQFIDPENYDEYLSQRS